MKWGYIRANPASGVDLPRLTPLRPKWVLTMVQARKLFAELQPLPRTLVSLALLTGMRRGELFALRWKNLDIQGGCLNVEQAVYDGVFDTPKTPASRRKLPLSANGLEMLISWKQRSKRTTPYDLIFATRTGKPISPNNVLQRHVSPACERIDLPRATWLTFRRTYSSWSHDNGVPDKVIAELMGHSNVHTTLNVYTQVMQGSLRLAVTKVSDQLFSNCSVAEKREPVIH